MAKKRQARTWLEVAVSNAGMRTGVRAMNWAYQWSVTREALGHEPSVEEVAEWWVLTRRTAFRDQAAFREAFPTLDSPAAIYNTDEARAALRKMVKLGEKAEELGGRLKGRTQEVGVIQLGGLPAADL